jgi:hypothetical protein
MPDDDKPEPVPFPVEVTVNGVRVTVTLMLKPGTTGHDGDRRGNKNHDRAAADPHEIKTRTRRRV